MNTAFKELKKSLSGELRVDDSTKIIYATDASAYREWPQAVVFPKTDVDIQQLIAFASKHQTSLIPRTAGTSLAGQVVGNGIVVDTSRYFTHILELNKEENWVLVEPGVIRDELNQFLRPHGVLFGPETSTSNRAMIGGMVGNNSCGSNSLVYGSTREHVLEINGFLSDGSAVTFGELTPSEFDQKLKLDNLEGEIYRHLYELLSDAKKREQIKSSYPNHKIKRRNTGYALDMLMDSEVFNEGDQKFNFCKLIAGSEGTLVFITSIKLKTTPLPPTYSGVVVAQFESLQESLEANLVALKHKAYAVELMDHHILECTEGHPLYSQYRFFLKGSPQALLVIQLHGETEDDLQTQAEALIDDLKSNNFGYHYPFITGSDVQKVWNLRKAGLGLLANIPGDDKAVPVIEDTCVDVNDLPAYIQEFNEVLQKRNLSCVHYAHVGTGELHLRPMINLKTQKGVELFKIIAQDIADLVKKYNGSLSGEHGDGRLRGEFIPQMVGEELYQDFKALKHKWDPQNIFNPGKIVDTPSMNTKLRYTPGQESIQIETGFDYSEHGGFQESIELCNGSADCRKTELTGGTMCPSYMVTRDELHSTRGRANTLRETITHRKEAAFHSEEVEKALDLCLMCKGCLTECPSNVDMASLKSEVMYQQHKAKPNRKAKQKAEFSQQMKRIQPFIGLIEPISKTFIGNWIKKSLDLAPEREIPIPAKQSFSKWLWREGVKEKAKYEMTKQKIFVFVDEFSEYLDPEVAKSAFQLLWSLGYDAKSWPIQESGRTYISNGFLDEAKQVAHNHLNHFEQLNKTTQIVGLEPSALLTFRDEYPRLLSDKIEIAQKLSDSTLLFEEFICQEIDAKRVKNSDFSNESQSVSLHGHCHQKALSSVTFTKRMLELPGYQVRNIPSGCCGMAGSFGYTHFELSQKIGELVLFPWVRDKKEDEIIAAPGTSCRQQIKDGTKISALHPVEILWKSRKKKQLSTR